MCNKKSFLEIELEEISNQQLFTEKELSFLSSFAKDFNLYKDKNEYVRTPCEGRCK